MTTVPPLIITRSTMSMDLLLPSLRCEVGESPLWHAAEQALYWVDIEGFAVHRWRFADGAHQRWSTAERPACLALHPAGGLLAGMDSGVFHLQLPADAPHALAEPLATVHHAEPGMRFNDGRCDRQGRFWAGTMARDMGRATAAGALYRFDHGGLSAPQVEGLLTPNGLAFSPDGRRMYLSDSHPKARWIWQMDLHDDGSLGPRTVFADLRQGPGRPDGAAVDTEGGYWVCGNDAGLVHRYTPDGHLERSLRVPVSKPAMCSFGGPQLDLLFVTTIRPAAPQGDDIALAGAVFVSQPGFTGLAEQPWCG